MKTKMLNPGQPCRKCGTAVVRIDRNPMKGYARTQIYAFSWWLRCPGCNETYMVESAKYKVNREQELPLLAVK